MSAEYDWLCSRYSVEVMTGVDVDRPKDTIRIRMGGEVALGWQWLVSGPFCSFHCVSLQPYGALRVRGSATS